MKHILSESQREYNAPKHLHTCYEPATRILFNNSAQQNLTEFNANHLDPVSTIPFYICLKKINVILHHCILPSSLI